MTAKHKHSLPEKWSAYQMTETFQAAVRRLGYKKGLHAADSDEVAHTAAVAVAMLGERGGAATDSFFMIVRQIMAEIDRTQRREPQFRYAERDGEKASLSLEEAKLMKTLPDQESSLVCAGIWGEIEKLPREHQRILKRTIMGDTPVDIAQATGDDIWVVLERLRVAREWMSDAIKDFYDGG